MEMPLPQPTSAWPARIRKLLPRFEMPPAATCWEVASLFFFMVFFVLYGVTPFFGGAGMGLVGADEPRYAQIAHEMLDRFDSSHSLAAAQRTCRLRRFSDISVAGVSG